MNMFKGIFSSKSDCTTKSVSESSKTQKKHTASVVPETEEDLTKKKQYLELLIEQMEKNMIDADKTTQKETNEVLESLRRDLDDVTFKLGKYSPNRPKHASVTVPKQFNSHKSDPPKTEEPLKMISSTSSSITATTASNDSEGEDQEEMDEHPKVFDYNGYQVCKINPTKGMKMGEKGLQGMINKIIGSDSGVKIEKSNEGMKIEFNAETRPRAKTKLPLRSMSTIDSYNVDHTMCEPEPEDEIFKPSGLFEDFFLVGIDREDVMKNPAELDEMETRFKTLYQFKENSEVSVDSYGSYLFPDGLEQLSKFKSDKSKQELIQKLVHKARDLNKNPIIILPFEPPSELLTAKWNPYTEKLNGHRRLYLISIICKDFIATEDPDNPESFVYYSCKFAMAFLTYYPLTPFFIYTLQQIYEYYRNARKIIMNKSSTPYDYDLIGSIQNFKNNFTPILTNLWKNFKTLKFGTKHQIYLDDANLQFRLFYEMPSVQLAPFMEGIWNLHYVFTHFSYSDIIFILSAFMLDKKIVLFCEDMTKLTSLETALFALMKPFAYPYKPTFSLPKYLIPILGVNISTIIGLTQNENFFWEESLMEQYPDCVFIFMDDMKVYASSKETGIKKMPMLPFYSDQRLQKAYFEINNSTERIPIYSKSKVSEARNKQFKHTKSAPLVLSEKDVKSKVVDIMTMFRTAIFENLVKPLIRLDWVCTTEEEHEKFLVNYSKLSAFHRVFVQTQTLRLFVESVEDKMKESVSLFTLESD